MYRYEVLLKNDLGKSAEEDPSILLRVSAPDEAAALAEAKTMAAVAHPEFDLRRVWFWSIHKERP